MFRNAWITPDNFLAICNTYYYQNHRDVVKKYLSGLKEHDPNLYNSLKKILDSKYTNNGYVNYNDFAIFVLGWIELCNKDRNAIVYCGYDFQEPLVNMYKRGDVRVDNVFTSSRMEYILIPYSSIQLLKIGVNKMRD